MTKWSISQNGQGDTLPVPSNKSRSKNRWFMNSTYDTYTG